MSPSHAKSGEDFIHRCPDATDEEATQAYTLPPEKHRHILEDVEGELEMEDASPEGSIQDCIRQGHQSLPFPEDTSLPPPPPPPLPQFSRKRSSFTSKSSQRYPCHRASLVPKEVVDKWDQLFFDGNATDVTILTDDGGSFQAHSIVLVGYTIFSFSL